MILKGFFYQDLKFVSTTVLSLINRSFGWIEIFNSLLFEFLLIRISGSSFWIWLFELLILFWSSSAITSFSNLIEHRPRKHVSRYIHLNLQELTQERLVMESSFYEVYFSSSKALFLAINCLDESKFDRRMARNKLIMIILPNAYNR